MAFVPFYTRFPETAEEETRSLMILDRESLITGNLESSEVYTYIDSYCDDLDCDCRTVFINVWSETQERVIATIHYGWENADYYEQWMHESCEEARMMAGVSLLGNPASAQAHKALELFMEMLQDSEYEARLRRHYRMFRQAVDKGRRQLTFTRKPARNAPCPCGSGRKYKGCCARSRAA